MKTLQEAIQFFTNPDNCLNYFVAHRWPNGVQCPNVKCGRKDVRFISTRRMWECKSNHPKKQFSVKIGTIFEDSAIPLDKWLIAMWMLANCKNGVSSYEIARTIGVTQKSAWFMMHRIRLAMKNKSLFKLGGSGNEVEVDETFVGGLAANMHRDRAKKYAEGGHFGKTVVMGLLDRQRREVRAKVVPNVKRTSLQTEILKQVKYGSAVYTDSHTAYDQLKNYGGYIHDVVNHAERYVSGRVHTNGLENFWSLLKRNLSGTYVAVEPFHLERYVDEQAFRFNNRKGSDAHRLGLVMSNILNKRLTYSELTGKDGTTF
jgi:transposase-like protein